MTNKFEEALELIEEEKNNNEIKYDLQVEKAKVLLLKHEFYEALKLLKDVNSKIPEEIDVIYLIGAISIFTGDIEEAHKYLKSLLNMKYNEKKSYLLGLYYYGVTLKKLDSKDKVKEYFKWLLYRYSICSLNNPYDVKIMLLKESVLYELEEYDKALEEAKRIEVLAPGIVETKFVQALIYKEKNNIKEYEKIKEKINKENSTMKMFLEFLGEGN